MQLTVHARFGTAIQHFKWNTQDLDGVATKICCVCSCAYVRRGEYKDQYVLGRRKKILSNSKRLGIILVKYRVLPPLYNIENLQK